MNRQGQRRRAVPPTWLLPISRSTMAAAFLENGQARTLWLSGVHRRSATKADAKILAGQDLDYSLDPFDDQSFYRSAARSRNAALEVTVGVSPQGLAGLAWQGKFNRRVCRFGGAAHQRCRGREARNRRAIPLSRNPGAGARPCTSQRRIKTEPRSLCCHRSRCP